MTSAEIAFYPLRLSFYLYLITDYVTSYFSHLGFSSLWNSCNCIHSMCRPASSVPCSLTAVQKFVSSGP